MPVAHNTKPLNGLGHVPGGGDSSSETKVSGAPAHADSGEWSLRAPGAAGRSLTPGTCVQLDCAAAGAMEVMNAPS